MAKLLVDFDVQYRQFVKDYLTMLDASLIDEKAIVALLIDTMKDNLGGKSYSVLNLAGKMSLHCRDKSILTEALIDLTTSIYETLSTLQRSSSVGRFRFVDLKDGMLVVEVE